MHVEAGSCGIWANLQLPLGMQLTLQGGQTAENVRDKLLPGSKLPLAVPCSHVALLAPPSQWPCSPLARPFKSCVAVHQVRHQAEAVCVLHAVVHCIRCIHWANCVAHCRRLRA